MRKRNQYLPVLLTAFTLCTPPAMAAKTQTAMAVQMQTTKTEDVGQARQGERQIYGTVTDENGEPLVGVIIKQKGGGTSLTDSEGKYHINIPQGEVMVTFSYLGMNDMMVTFEPKDKSGKFNVRLTTMTHNVDEVVVTGYQTISRERATGSYSIIDSDDLKARHSSNLADALDGLVAGIQSNDDGSGNKRFTIRGTSTMLADNTPLVVVDGYPIMDNNSTGGNSNLNLSALQRINPEDVESVTVLKDAAAASIWGARSANGVIVITTKKNKQKNSFTVEGNTQLTIGQKQDVARLTNLATARQTINYQRWAFENGMIGEEYSGDISNLTNAINYSELLMYQGYRWGTITKDEMNSQLSRLAAFDNRQQIKDKMLRTPLNSSTTASISGNVGNWNTRASVNYIYDAGDFIGHRDNTWRMNWDNNYRFNKWVAVNVGLNLVQSNRHSSQLSWSDISKIAPYEMLLNEDGSYAKNWHDLYNTDVLDQYDWSGFTYTDMNYNLLQEARRRNRRVVNTQMRTQLGLEVDIIDGLQFNSKFQYETSRYRTRETNDEESFFTRYRVNYFTPGDMMGHALGESAIPAGAIIVNSRGKNHSALFRNDLSLNKVFGEKHAVAAVAGNEISNYYYQAWTLPYLYGVTPTSSGVNGQDKYFETMDGSQSTINGVPADGKAHVVDSWSHDRFVSFYGNASYMYDERYGISASARSDASNLITKEAKYRWSPLWSVGAMWNIANEKWMKDKTPFDRLTLRLTYGKNGNAASASSAYTTLNTESGDVDIYTGHYLATITDYGNPTLRWEKTASTDIGLDFSLLGGALYGTFDYYNKKSTDVLGNVAVASVTGTSQAVFNNAELNNRGFELTLGGRAFIGDVMVGGNFTWAYNKNKVTKLYNEVNNVSDMMNATYIPGYPMASIFKMRYGGLKNGIPQVLDKDGNSYDISDYSIYDMDWRDILVYQGTSISPHTMSLMLSASWKDLSLNVYLNGRFGGKMQMPAFNYYFPDNYGGKQSVMAQVGDVMNDDGSIKANTYCMPLPTTDDEGNAIDINNYSVWSTVYSTFDYSVESASYIYLQEIDLNYTLPSKLFKGLWLKGIDVYGKLENVGLLWTANSKGYNPLYLPGSYEPQMQFTIGANVKF